MKYHIVNRSGVQNSFGLIADAMHRFMQISCVCFEFKAQCWNIKSCYLHILVYRYSLYCLRLLSVVWWQVGNCNVPIASKLYREDQDQTESARFRKRLAILCAIIMLHVSMIFIPLPKPPAGLNFIPKKPTLSSLCTYPVQKKVYAHITSLRYLIRFSCSTRLTH